MLQMNSMFSKENQEFEEKLNVKTSKEKVAAKNVNFGEND